MCLRYVIPILLLAVLGCARIYRPASLAPPQPPVQNADLAGSLVLQPWGDNSRYEARARESHLRVAVLQLENRSGANLEVVGLQPPEDTTRLQARTAASLVRQQVGSYVIYPLLPGVLAAGASSKGSFGPSDQTAFLALALVGACIGMPNAAFASRSNHRLETFFQDAAWMPGTLEPGRVSRGLVFFRSPDPGAPLPVEVSYRIGDRPGRLRLICPGWARGGKSRRR